jgi:hypothetical protein
MRQIGSRLELFVDDWLIERMQGTRLSLHSPVPREVALRFDDVPWEGTGCHYPTVIHDGSLYRAYYRGLPQEDVALEDVDGGPSEVTCLAESTDGIHWMRPSLGLFEVQGTRENNVVLNRTFSPIPHNFCPFLDTRPGVPPAERLKGLGGLFDIDGRRPHTGGLVALASPDGVHWRKLAEKAVIGRAQYPIFTDTAESPAFWSDTEGCYVCYIRTWKGEGSPDVDGAGGTVNGFGGRYRWIGRTTSVDFLHWSPVVALDFGDAPMEHLYTNQVHPYFRAPHIYLGFPFRFFPGRKAVPEHPWTGVSDAVLMTSRDGVHWDRRFMEAFLRPGREPQNWTQRSNALAVGVVPTGADEMSVYWIEHYEHPTARLRRGTLRLDGFTSLNAGYCGGEAVTHPFSFIGRQLVLNYATSAAGSVRVEIQDAEGHALPGFTLEECPEMYGDQIEQPACWAKGSDLSDLAGQPVRLRLALKDADVYSFRFTP